jgi:D-cysteine desulfhydrase family pyridoxal phosphate-dependent enzyme
MTPAELRERLAAFPRLRYGSYPTPLEPLDNLTRSLHGPRLWVKRDDGLGPGMGGNKARKLEFLMAETLEKGKRKVVTFGGLQSNHARMTAAACAGVGLEAHLFFFERRPESLQGNLLLDRLFGAKMHFIPFGGGGAASMTIETTIRLVRLASTLVVGPGAYFMPVGGHNVRGCLGYVVAACELQEQVDALGLAGAAVTVVTAAGTGGTLAGLVAGLALLESPIKVLAIDVGKLWKAFPSSLARLAGELCSALGANITFRPEDMPIIEGDYVGPGYAQDTVEAGRAIRTMAESEGILLDPVYTGKAFAGVLDLAGKGRFAADEQIIFLHTGGTPGLWAGLQA